MTGDEEMVEELGAIEHSDHESHDEPAKSDTMRDKIDAGIRSWFVEYIHNSPVSRSGESLNHVSGSLGALRESIMKELA